MEIISPPTLYRAHSKKYLTDRSGRFMNPNISRERRPRDLPIQIHTSVRDWFIEKFGIDYRGKSLFCSGDISVARGYKTDRNEIVSLYPEGEFSLCFSPFCKDLFGFYQFNWMDPEASVEKIREDLGALAFIQASNSGLAEAAESGNEVMIFGTSFSRPCESRNPLFLNDFRVISDGHISQDLIQWKAIPGRLRTTADGHR